MKKSNRLNFSNEITEDNEIGTEQTLKLMNTEKFVLSSRRANAIHLLTYCTIVARYLCTYKIRMVRSTIWPDV